MASHSPQREALISLASQNISEIKTGDFQVEPTDSAYLKISSDEEVPLLLVGVQDIGTVSNLGGACVAIYEKAETAAPRDLTKAFGDKRPTGPYHLAVYRHNADETDARQLEKVVSVSRARGLGRDTVRIIELLQQAEGHADTSVAAGPLEAYIPIDSRRPIPVH